MDGQDKGLVMFRGRRLVEYAVEALQQAADRVLISANRNRPDYEALGYPVVADAGGGFDGPLAGLLAALKAARTPYVLCIPCDSPLLDGRLLGRLYETLIREAAEACVAHDGQRLHPVFAILERRLAGSLEEYLATGERRMEGWLRRLRLAMADFSDHPASFMNVNSTQELAELEKCLPES